MKHLMYFLKQIHSYSGRALYINLISMILIGLLEGVGILLLIPMISITGVVNLDIGDHKILEIFNGIKEIPSSISLPVILGTYVLLVTGQHIVQRRITIQNTIIQHGFFRHMRVETYSKILNSKWSFFLENRKSDLINLLTGEIARASAGTHSFLQFMSSLIFTSIQIIVALLLSPNITIFVMLCGLILIFFNRKFLKTSLALGNRNFELGKNYLAGITDQINGIKEIKSNTLENDKLNWYRSITKNMQDEQIEYTKMKTKSQLYYKVSSAILIALFIFVAINVFNSQTGQLMVIIVIFSRLWPRVAGIQASMEQIATTIPSFKSVVSLQQECESAAEFENVDQLKINPLRLVSGIECKGVHFKYNENRVSYTLNDINIFIKANEMTALVGHSGAGKSTLIDLVMGLNQPQKGEIFIDGIPLSREKILSLRRSISYIPQDPFLFNTSIRENLLLVKPHADEKELWEALEFSSAAEFVKKLPNGLDTLIGDRGIKLSGGERQRVVLARAILRKPSILVLDEATSALDSENESKIQEAIDQLKGKMTIIVIAHRLSTIKNADQVIVLDKGSVIQTGGFHQLSKEKRSMFSNLLEKQMGLSL
ncbi:ABC transporter ATP-binding protein [Rossellomorea aquimaris]|uniref:ABC transporter ATP-binding protein n=1 Tax=Rossellomorea aquimaris TaxID=189382 RepID=UPI0007D06B0F|nr:ABC transporter ATP-binding protein [Rossellomorea aquimaris]